MAARITAGLLQYLPQLEELISPDWKRYAFTAMLANVICALLCEMRPYEGIAEWAKPQGPNDSRWWILAITKSQVDQHAPVPAASQMRSTMV